MTNARRCERCGAPAPESAALDGLCPACLLRRAVLPAPSCLRILTRLGAGPSSVAYLAEHPDTPSRLLVLKKITVSADAQDVASRVAALRAVSLRLCHRQIARVLDLGLDDRGQPYAVTEFWPGIPITRFIRSGDAGALACDVRAALAFAHGCGLVHGSLTGTNVLVARTASGPAVKVLDFGHAALAGRGGEPDEDDDLRALDRLL